MPGTNSGGLRIPFDSDPLGNVAAAVRELADDIVTVQNTRCKIYNSVNQSIPNNVSTPVLFGAEEVDPTGMHSTAVNNSRITITRAGRYRITAQVGFAANASGYRQIILARNGMGVAVVRALAAPAAGVAPYLQASGTVQCAQTEYLELQVLQTSGGALDTVAGLFNTWLDVEYLGPL